MRTASLLLGLFIGGWICVTIIGYALGWNPVIVGAMAGAPIGWGLGALILILFFRWRDA